MNGETPPSGATVVAATTVSLAISGGPGNAYDWVALYPVGAADGDYLRYYYLSGTDWPPEIGLTSATFPTYAPLTAGAYEWRMFADNGWTVIATSGVVTVTASPAVLRVNDLSPPTPITLVAGSAAVVTLEGGTGHALDSIGLYRLGETDTLVDWRYFNGSGFAPGVSTATLNYTAPGTVGAYEFRFLAEGGGVLTTTAVEVVPSTATMSVNGIAPPTTLTVAPGAALTVDVAGGPGHAFDWIGVAIAGAPDTDYIDWQYLNGSGNPPGLASATRFFTAPSTPGTYELRLFADNGYDRLTTSGAVVVGIPEPPAVSVILTSPFPGTTFNAPTGVTLSAAATITGATITRVDFFTGSTLIGSASTAPYETTWTSPAVGEHMLTAAGVDSTTGVTISATVPVTIGPPGSTEGTLGPPRADPPSGVYGSGQSVTLTAATDATIRYTLDGSEPNESSEVYDESISLTAATVLKARAFRQDWSTSGTTTSTYSIDAAPPAIIATVDPPANVNGWHRSDVTVSFSCTDLSALASCPSPVVLSDDGEGQLVTVNAADVHGNSASLSVTINIDRTPPMVSITAPENNVVTSDATLAITGPASDNLAGIGIARCNGEPAILSAGVVECSVELRPGVNSVVINVLDLAGNSRSAGLRVRRTGQGQRLSITPREPTIRVGQAIDLQAVTEFGPVTTGVVWSLSETGIASLSGGSDTVLTADAPGVVTLTATLGVLVAETDITVLLGALPFGSSVWKDIGSPVGGTRVIYRPVGIGNSGAELFAISPREAGSGADVRALDANGHVLWTESTPGEPIFSDVYGGLLATVSDTALTRLAGGGGLPWTYQTDGYIISRPVQTTEGLIAFVERDSEGAASYAVGLDGQSGSTHFRVRLPEGVATLDWANNCVPPSGPFDSRFPASAGPMAVGEDGAVYFQLLTYNLDEVVTDCSVLPWAGTLATTQVLSLAKVSSVGALTLQSLWTGGFPPMSSDDWIVHNVVPTAVAPNGQGGIVASFQVFETRPGPDHISVNAFLWNDGVTYSIPPRYALENTPDDLQHSPLEFVGDGGTVYLRSETGITAFDIQTGEAKWTTPNTTMVAPRLNGGALFQTADGDLIGIDRAGSSAILSNLPIDNPVQLRLGIYTGTSNGEMVAMSATATDEASFSFELSGLFLDPTEASETAQSSGAAIERRSTREDFAMLTFLNFVWPATENHGVEYSGIVCREANRQFFYWHKFLVGNTTNAGEPIPMEPEQCADGASTVAYGHTHPDQNGWADQYPSGYQSRAVYDDADLNPNNGANWSDLKIANEHIWAQHPQPRYRDLTFYLAGRDLSDLLVFSRYKRTSELYAEDNIYRYNLVTDRWERVPNAPW